MDVVYHQHNIQIFHHRHHKVLHMKWKGPKCREGYLAGVAALKQLSQDLGVEGWLINLGDCQKLLIKGIKSLTEMVSSLKESNLKRYARVQSQDEEYEKNVKTRFIEYNHLNNPEVTVGSFETEAEALAWLFGATEGTLEEDH